MATKAQVEGKLRELIARLDSAGDAQGSLADGLKQPRIIAVEVPDLGAEYWSEMTGGRMGDLREGAPERADIRLRADSDHLVDVLDGRRSMMSAVMGGQVKVHASLSDLMALRRLA